jgi:hypothetical protein
MLGREEGPAVGARAGEEPEASRRRAGARGDRLRGRALAGPVGGAIWKACLALAVASIAALSAGDPAGSATARPSAREAKRASPARTVALWRMDERHGRLMRDAVRSHDGRLRSVRLGVPGFAGTAYRFDGRESQVAVHSASDLNPHRKRIVVALHMRTNGRPAKSHDWDLIRKGFYSTPGGEYKMEYYASGRASCGFNGSSDYAELVARPRLDDGRWHSVRCVKNRSRIKTIVDGRAFSKRARVGRIANGARVVVGARPGSDWYRGSLDQARVKIG